MKEVSGEISNIVKLYLFKRNDKSISLSRLTIIAITSAKTTTIMIIRKLRNFWPDSSFSNKKDNV